MNNQNTFCKYIAHYPKGKYCCSCSVTVHLSNALQTFLVINLRSQLIVLTQKYLNGIGNILTITMLKGYLWNSLKELN